MVLRVPDVTNSEEQVEDGLQAVTVLRAKQLAVLVGLEVAVVEDHQEVTEHQEQEDH